jgi:MoxR-like ATPase
MAMLDRFQTGSPLEALEPVTDAMELQRCQNEVTAIHVDPVIKEYCVRLVQRTRQHPDVGLGASPRGSLGLLHAAQARAAAAAREYVLPDDVKELAASVLTHRIVVRPNAELRGVTASSVLAELLDTEAVPVAGRRLA